jgi:hypothetical protein
MLERRRRYEFQLDIYRRQRPQAARGKNVVVVII